MAIHLLSEVRFATSSVPSEEEVRAKENEAWASLESKHF
jgi:hypothetical protein